jgi:hypothetical protein
MSYENNISGYILAFFPEIGEVTNVTIVTNVTNLVTDQVTSQDLSYECV